MAAVELILLQRVEKLGQMGDLVKVKPGFARNYLLPQKKALRASKENLARFEQERAQLEAQNLKRREEAERVAERVGGLSVVIIRQAGESGSLYGSVSSRDIAEMTTAAGLTINRAAGVAGAPDQDARALPGTRGAASGGVDPGYRERRAQPGRGRAAGAWRTGWCRGRGRRGRPRRRCDVRSWGGAGAATGLKPPRSRRSQSTGSVLPARGPPGPSLGTHPVGRRHLPRARSPARTATSREADFQRT